jgi:hypothetical protein
MSNQMVTLNLNYIQEMLTILSSIREDTSEQTSVFSGKTVN